MTRNVYLKIKENKEIFKLCKALSTANIDRHWNFGKIQHLAEIKEWVGAKVCRINFKFLGHPNLYK